MDKKHKLPDPDVKKKAAERAARAARRKAAEAMRDDSGDPKPLADEVAEKVVKALKPKR